MSRKRALHPYERKYLMDAANGYTAHQSAKRNGVSVHTVQSSIKTAKSALGAFNVTHAVTLALTYGEFTLKDIYDRGL